MFFNTFPDRKLIPTHKPRILRILLGAKDILQSKDLGSCCGPGLCSIIIHAKINIQIDYRVHIPEIVSNLLRSLLKANRPINLYWLKCSPYYYAPIQPGDTLIDSASIRKRIKLLDKIIKQVNNY